MKFICIIPTLSERSKNGALKFNIPLIHYSKQALIRKEKKNRESEGKWEWQQ
jgi:hypothetical protein